LGVLNSETFVMGKKKNEKSLDNTSALVKAMNAGNSGVRAGLNPQSQYILTVGAFKHNNEILPFPGITRPENPGSDYIPVFHHVNYGAELKFSSSYSTAWFRTALTAGNFEKIKLSLKPGAADKLRDLLSMEEKLPASVPVFTIGSVTYYPWYDAEAQQFTIRAIK
jgi:hypothetical protein